MYKGDLNSSVNNNNKKQIRNIEIILSLIYKKGKEPFFEHF